MREIKFSQHHRRTGERRRFVISQFVDTAATVSLESVDDGPYLDSAGPLAWHYIAQAGDTGPWTDFRRLDVAADAPDEEVRKKATRDLSSRVWEQAPN